MADNDSKIREFQEVTGLPEAEARALLEAADGNIETATDLFYAQNEMDTDSPEHSDQEASRPSTGDASAAQQASTGPVRGSGAAKPSSSRFQTFSDIRARAESEEEDKKKEDLFAGGEKSGIAVQKNPDPIKAIFEKAAHGKKGWDSDEEEGSPQPEARRSAFSGAGRTLGSEDTPAAPASSAAPQASRSAPPKVEVVRRTLTFWKDGFSVEDGPLLRYDDPANKQILALIESGRAPASLMNIEYGQKCEVVLSRRTEEMYAEQPRVRRPFEGRGNRLGSPSPAAGSSSSQTPAAASPALPAAAPPTATAPQIQVSDSEPTTTLQIRLADGTRIRSRFNQSHTVGDIYVAVNAASRESSQRPYVLQTAFPSVKDLTDKTVTLKDAGLLQCAIMQKWT